MPRSLNFHFNDSEISLTMHKVDRSRLYGFKEVEVVDENDNKCELATLAEDGRTVVGKGGTALAYLSVDGNWCERDKIKPVNLEGDEITPVKSSFSSAIDLREKVSIDEYLNHNIRLIYRMELNIESEEDGPTESDAFENLMQELKSGAIYNFPYSFRGGLEADAGFLLTNHNDELFFVVGDRSNVEMIGLQQVAAATQDEEPSSDAGADLMDFDMI